MRVNIPSIVLSLAIASSVYAAPAPHVELEKRGWVTDKLKELFTKALKTMECGACVAALIGAKDIAYLNKNWVLDAVNELCPAIAKQPADVVKILMTSHCAPLKVTLLPLLEHYNTLLILAIWVFIISAPGLSTRKDPLCWTRFLLQVSLAAMERQSASMSSVPVLRLKLAQVH